MAKEARSYVTRFPKLHIQWVPREQNQEADDLSKKKLKEAKTGIRVHNMRFMKEDMIDFATEVHGQYFSHNNEIEQFFDEWFKNKYGNVQQSETN